MRLPANSALVSDYNTALRLKFTLERLLGREEWYRLKDHRGIKPWRKACLRALRGSLCAIDASVRVADASWREEAKHIVQTGIDQVGGIDDLTELCALLAATYLELSFHQFGLMPNRSGQTKVRSVPAHYDLSAFRSVQYVQTEEQAKRLARYINRGKQQASGG